MRKILAMILALCVICASTVLFASCGDNEDNNDSGNNKDNTQSQNGQNSGNTDNGGNSGNTDNGGNGGNTDNGGNEDGGELNDGIKDDVAEDIF